MLADAPISMSKLLYRQIIRTEIDALESTLNRAGPDLLVGGYNFSINLIPDDIPASPETNFELFSVQLSSFDFSFRTFEMLCQKGSFTVADLVQESRQGDFFTIGLSGFDKNSINEARAFLRALEKEGHIQQNIEIDQITDDEIEADGQFETSEKTLNDFLNRPLESMAWT